jgi:hypothetical protein
VANSAELYEMHVVGMREWYGTIDESGEGGESEQQGQEIPNGSLKLHEVTVVHEGTPVLRNLSLEITMRDHLVVIAPSAAGQIDIHSIHIHSRPVSYAYASASVFASCTREAFSKRVLEKSSRKEWRRWPFAFVSVDVCERVTKELDRKA